MKPKKHHKWKASWAHDRPDGWEIFNERNNNRLCGDMTADSMQVVMHALKVSQAADDLIASKGWHNTMLAYKALESAFGDV